VTLAGTIWITDHRQNRVSEYDPSTGSWPQSLVLPTPNSWPTAGEEDPATGDVYFTEYNSSRLARKPLAGPFVEIDAPPASGPAFLVHSSGKIYFTEWLQARLAAYEIATGVVTEYQFPVAGELAGPIDLLPGGLIAVGTRNVGYIMVFNPATETFAAHPVPTASPGLKDGLRSDAGGAIWFTESGSNRIAVLRLGGTAPVADFSGAPLSGVAPLSVTFSDLSTNAPTGWSWSFGDGGSAVGASPTHVYATPGTYAVTLTVSSDYGYDTEVKPSYITVFPPCPVSSGALAISAQRQAHDVILTWPPHPDCAWDVHRVTDPQLMLGSPPIASTTSPSYVDQAPPEPLVCYEVVPTDR
jgi:DNA-binding beta-propeller fold protein YncE